MIMLQRLSIRRALVVDDSMLIRHTICRLLHKYDFEVESATNGVDALRILTRFRPSVIFATWRCRRWMGISSSPLSRLVLRHMTLRCGSLRQAQPRRALHEEGCWYSHGIAESTL